MIYNFNFALAINSLPRFVSFRTLATAVPARISPEVELENKGQQGSHNFNFKVVFVYPFVWHAQLQLWRDIKFILQWYWSWRGCINRDLRIFSFILWYCQVCVAERVYFDYYKQKFLLYRLKKAKSVGRASKHCLWLPRSLISKWFTPGNFSYSIAHLIRGFLLITPC